MKKITMIPALVLSLCICAGAMALEINTAPLYVYDSSMKVSMVDHHDRLLMSKDDAGAMAMPDGTVLTEPVFTAVYGSSNYYGLIKTQSAVNYVHAEGDDQDMRAEGFIDETGRTIVPAEYQWANTLNMHWAVGGRVQKVADGADYDISVSVIGGNSYKGIFTEYDIYFVD